jgi:hypothetical protein
LTVKGYETPAISAIYSSMWTYRQPLAPIELLTTNLGVGSSNLPRCATFIFDFSIG